MTADPNSFPLDKNGTPYIPLSAGSVVKIDAYTGSSSYPAAAIATVLSFR